MAKVPTLMIKGYISYPKATMAEALAANERAEAQYKKQEDRVSPSARLIINKDEFKKYKEYVLDVLAPHFNENPPKGGEKALVRFFKMFKGVEQLIESPIDEDGEYELSLPFQTGLRRITDKDREALKDVEPDAYVAAAVRGFPQKDWDVKALLTSDNVSQLLGTGWEDMSGSDFDPGLESDKSGKIKLPQLTDIRNTKLNGLVGGYNVGIRISPYAYVSGGEAGISLGCNTIIIRDTSFTFGGGEETLSEEEISKLVLD